MTSAEWIALAERCEKATGPDREIDFFPDTRVKSNRETDELLKWASEYFYFDAASGALTWKRMLSWRTKIGGVAGWQNSNGYRQVRIMGGTFMVHRICWALHYGSWPNGIIDHIDGNRSNNTIENMREATGSLNAFNKALPSGCGVYARNGKFTSRIQRNGSSIELGMFETEKEAAAAYRGATIALYGYGARQTRAMAAKESDHG